MAESSLSLGDYKCLSHEYRYTLTGTVPGQARFKAHRRLPKFLGQLEEHSSRIIFFPTKNPSSVGGSQKVQCSSTQQKRHSSLRGCKRCALRKSEAKAREQSCQRHVQGLRVRTFRHIPIK